MNRAEDNIIDLKLAVSATLQAIDKNSADIADLIKASTVLQSSQMHTDGAIRDSRSTLALVNATMERMDRLFDYLMRCDRGQPEWLLH